MIYFFRMFNMFYISLQDLCWRDSTKWRTIFMIYYKRQWFVTSLVLMFHCVKWEELKRSRLEWFLFSSRCSQKFFLFQHSLNIYFFICFSEELYCFRWPRGACLLTLAWYALAVFSCLVIQASKCVVWFH